MFEVLCGRLCFDYKNYKHQSFARLVQKSYEQNTLNEIIYDNIKGKIHPQSLKVFTTIAYQCLRKDREERPLISKAVMALEAALQCQVDDTYICPEIFEELVSDIMMIPVKQGILKVKVLRAMKLKAKKNFGACDPYVKLGLSNSPNPSKYTTVKRNSVNPAWYEEFNLVVKDLDFQSLHINVYDRNKRGKRLGSSMISLKDLTPKESMTVTLDLLYDILKIGGQIMITMVFNPYAHDQIPANLEVEGTLSVIIYRGTDLQGVHHTNPFVRLLFQGNEKKTKSVNNERNPEWWERFTYQLEKPPVGEILHLEVASTSWMGLIYPEECLGYVDINLTDLVVKNEVIRERFNLVDSKNGQLRVDLRWVTSSSTTRKKEFNEKRWFNTVRKQRSTYRNSILEAERLNLNMVVSVVNPDIQPVIKQVVEAFKTGLQDKNTKENS